MAAAVDNGSENCEGSKGVEAELFAWVGTVTGRGIVGQKQISGGNRCRSWAMELDGDHPPVYLRFQPPREETIEPYTVWRESRIYRLLSDSAVPAPRLIAVHERHQAIITELSRGEAGYRRLDPGPAKQRIAEDCAHALAALHALPLDALDLEGFTPGETIGTAVRRELSIWRAMYEEVGTPDPLVVLALDWLEANMPEPDAAAVLVHGDAGPGNFLFEEGRMTALLDWELAHPGDPMEDIAWFSMRSVMEPPPDFSGVVRAYEAMAGQPVDVSRIAFHRVFVSTRVVIIRHRNITGEPGNSIVSRALNRRLLVQALSEASGRPLPAFEPEDVPDTERTALFDGVIDDLRHRIGGDGARPAAISSVKNAAKVLKYLREHDRLGRVYEDADLRDLHALLEGRGREGRPDDVALSTMIAEGRIDFGSALDFLSRRVLRESRLAALSSGGLAARQLPDLPRIAV